MAATQLAPAAASANITAVTNPVLNAFHDVLAQIGRGITTPTVSLTGVTEHGSAAVELWKSIVEASLSSRIELRWNLAANAVTVVPIEHMTRSASTCETSVTQGNQSFALPAGATTTSDTAIDSAAESEKATKKGKAKDKVPRPRNAFIIYRAEWHPRIVQENPKIQNNNISKILGAQWRGESSEVKEAYKRLAEDEKRQHAINNPGYQYAPRKPSEKKKRMTRHKALKLRLQQEGIEVTRGNDLDELLAAAAADNQVTVNSYLAPYRQGLSSIQDNGAGFDSFVVGDEQDGLLYNHLVEWNASQPPPAQNFGAPAAAGVPSYDGEMSFKATQFAAPVPIMAQHALPAAPTMVSVNPSDVHAFSAGNGTATSSTHYIGTNTAGNSTNATSSASNTTFSNNNSTFNNVINTAEVDRQQTLFDDELMNDLFDLDAFDIEVE